MVNIYTKIFITIILFFISFNLKANSNYFKFNYGISSNNIEASAASDTGSGAITTDEDDTGYMLSGGYMIGDNWGVDLMYYDMGDSTITVTKDDILKVENANFSVETAGDITRNVTGFGIGLITASNNENKLLSLDYYLKLGIHSWDEGGSTTLMDDDTGFKSKYYNKGIGAYGGIGISMNLYENTSLDFAYDIIGVSSSVDFDNNSSLLSAGLRFKF